MKKKYMISTLLIIVLGVFMYIFMQKDPLGGAEKSVSSGSTKNEEKKEEKKNEEFVTVEIPFDKQQLIGVKTTLVQFMPVQKSIKTVGRVEVDEKALSFINTKFEGWIEKLYINTTGVYVKKGDPLIEIYSPELYSTQLEFLNALKWKDRLSGGSDLDKLLLKDAESVLDASKRRLNLWDISEEQIKRIEELRTPLRSLTLYSPTSGYVMKKPAINGMRIMPGDRLFEIADLSSVWIIADIYEYELPLIDVGQEAEITLSYLPGRSFKARIEFVYPFLSGETRTLKVRFSLPNKDGILKPQMFTDVVIKRNLGKRLIIPEDAVLDTGLRQIVYVDKGDGYFEPRNVTLGLRADGVVEVLKGLRAGERIASSATFLIDSEAKLKGLIQ
jgi:Cu(I)/Ag(I) efflux system membrane fusion protein